MQDFVDLRITNPCWTGLPLASAEGPEYGTIVTSDEKTSIERPDDLSNTKEDLDEREKQDNSTESGSHQLVVSYHTNESLTRMSKTAPSPSDLEI